MGSKETTTKDMPQFQEDFLRETVLPYAEDIAGREFQAYEGERVAGLTPLQQQAQAGYSGLDMGADRYQQAADIYGNLEANQLATTNLDPYMSPYQQAVIDASLRTLGGAQEQALNKQGAQASRAGAFGGSRHGIAEAETRKAYGQQAQDLVTNQMQQGFMNAQQAAQADMARRMQSAAGLSATAGAQLQSQLAGLGGQMGAGDAARTLDQASLDAAFAEFGREQDFPLTGFNALLGAASGIPTGYGTTTTQQGGMGPTLGAVGSIGMGFGPKGFGLFGG